MFERFTEPSRAVLVEAQDVAVEMGSDYIGAGHILYGCAEGREETAGRSTTAGSRPRPSAADCLASRCNRPDKWTPKRSAP
jgi:hypothetical protein